MAITTLRPNSTVAAGGNLTITGAASAHAALADDSTATYIQRMDGETSTVTLGFPDTIPSDLPIARIALRLTTVQQSPPFQAHLRCEIRANAATWSRETFIAWTGIATTEMAASGAPSPAGVDPDSLTVYLGPGSAAFEQARVHALYLDVTYVETPDLTVGGPTGTIENTNRPTVSWAPDLDSDGGAQTFYEVAIVADGDDPDADPILVGSEVRAGSGTSWQADESLPDGAYDCYVRIAQTVNGIQHWSDWVKSDFALDVPIPADPDIALVPESSEGRMRLDIEGGLGGDATTDIFEVQVSYDGGTSWATLRTPDGFGLATPDAGVVMLWDHEGGNGQAAAYRVRAGHDYSGSYAWSAWVPASGAWGPTSDQWLKHPLNPSLNIKVRIHAYGSSSRGVRQGKMQPLGRSTPITATDKRLAREGAVAFLVETDDHRDALDALLDAPGGLPFLLQVAASDKRPDRWVLLGQADREYLIDKAYVGEFVETFGWVEMARP